MHASVQTHTVSIKVFVTQYPFYFGIKLNDFYHANENEYSFQYEGGTLLIQLHRLDIFLAACHTYVESYPY